MNLVDYNLSIDIDAHEKIHNTFTKHLAQAMGNTKDMLAAQILRSMWDDAPPSYIQEVDFGE